MTSNPREGSHLAVVRQIGGLQFDGSSIRMTDKGRNNRVMRAVEQRIFKRESELSCQRVSSFHCESLLFFLKRNGLNGLPHFLNWM